MKAFREVEKDRKLYHKSAEINTVHRSSLLVPKIEKNKTFISFLNHFLIKRKYTNVALKITGYKHDGSSGDSISYKLEEPRVYSFYLEEILGDEFNCYQVEFFCSNNLFIPFPAVCINHVGVGNVNSVHSFNRILNDVREMDKISSIKVKEASIDLALNKKINTFIIFQSGLKNIASEYLIINIKHSKNKTKEIVHKIPLNLSKMTSHKINLFPILSKYIQKDISAGEYFITIAQPSQIMFYGRLLVGVEDLHNGSFSANHSYYDNSETLEYFQNKKSYKTFPFFNGFKNQVRIYPIMSPGEGTFFIFANFDNGREIKQQLLNEYCFINNKTTLNLDIDDLLLKASINKSLVKTFTIIYKANNDNLSPTRINLQLVNGVKNQLSIDSSVNVSLHNDEIFLPKKDYYESWGQMLNKVGYKSSLAIYFGNYYEAGEEEPFQVEIQIYDEKGIITEKNIFIKKLEKYIINASDFKSSSEFIWVVAKSTKNNINIFAFHTNLKTGFSSGEHGF